ncbi:MAG: hypothetical protein ACP5KC_08875 [Infirmifilum sp.]
MVETSKNIDTFIFASSSIIYCENLKLPIPEHYPLNPKLPYAAFKTSDETFIKAFSKL